MNSDYLIKNYDDFITRYNIYNTRTDFVPKISDRVPSSKITGSVWLRYAPREPRWSDLMDIRTDC